MLQLLRRLFVASPSRRLAERNAFIAHQSIGNTRRFRTLGLFLIPCLSAVSAAQRDTTSLPTVVITATRLSTPVGTTISSVTVLDGADLRARGVTSVVDALRTVPGASLVSTGGPGAQTSLFLRGGESDYVRFLVDGVPVNDPGGAMDLAALTMDNVDRIEIVRGPASVLYGSDAVTGVVQVFTRRATRPRELDITAGTGSHGLREGSIGMGTRAGAWSARAAIARSVSDGILAFNNQYANTVMSAQTTWSNARGITLALAGRSTDDRFHYPTDGAGAVVDHNAFRADRRRSLSVDAALPLTTHVRLEATLSGMDGRGATRDDADGPADTLGLYAYRSAGTIHRQVAETRVVWNAAALGVGTLGTEVNRETQRGRDSSNYGSAANDFSAHRSTRAVYAQWVGSRGRVEYSLGARLDDNTVFGTFRTARIGASVALWSGARLRGSYGNAFKAPTFLEQFNTAFSVGNQQLVPERSRGGEVGITQSAANGRVTAAATVFDQRFRDLIQYTYVDEVSPNYFNVAAASARGVELELRSALIEHLQLFGNATLLHTRVDDAGFDTGSGATFVAGERLLRRPSHTFTLGAIAQPTSRLSLDVSLLRVGDRDDRDFAGYPPSPLVLPAYTRADVGGRVAVPIGSLPTALILRIENVGGARYSEVANFPAPGRVLRVGVRMSASGAM